MTGIEVYPVPVQGIPVIRTLRLRSVQANIKDLTTKVGFFLSYTCSRNYNCIRNTAQEIAVNDKFWNRQPPCLDTVEFKIVLPLRRSDT